ncbi:UpxY family transcription antiterminator [Pedobacter sp. SAFR-022]|uniref:UpxY family transcription antiterminator n=1 Tax=Pedobacter sp. SAFR-022 TaxID=3436861 RepID=UPI003F802668
MEYQWHAVYTKSRWEKKVAEQLSKLNIESYCPLNKVVRQWSDRKKTVEEPLFTSYVFVKISNKELAKIRQVLGVVNFVYWLGRPAIIPAKEISIIKEFLNNYVNVRLEPLLLNVQDPVKIINGPFADIEGSVISIGKKSVRVSLPSLRYFMTTEVEIDNVKKITKQGQMIQRIAI